MKRKLIYIISGLAVVLVLISIGAWRLYHVIHRVEVEEVDSIIRRKIPSGSSRSEVVAFIESLNIESLEVKNFGYNTDLRRFDFEGGIFDDKTKRHRANLRGYLDARILNTHKTYFLTSCDIRLRFYFDKSEQLIDYGIQQECDGP